MNKNQHSKIKTISVKRKIEEEYIATRMVNKNVDVELTDLTVDEIYQLPLELSRAVGVAFKKLYEEYKSISTEQSGLINFISEPTPTPQATEAEEGVKIPINDQTSVTEHPHVGSGSNDELIGNKHEKATSIYHYVYFDRTQKCWRTTHNNIKHKTEIEAALASDAYLDQTSDTKRPKNVDEFKEIMEAYNDAA